MCMQSLKDKCCILHKPYDSGIKDKVKKANKDDNMNSTQSLKDKCCIVHKAYDIIQRLRIKLRKIIIS